MNPYQELAIQALNNLMGDDLYRAKSAFRHCSEEEMQTQWGQSGKTRRQILQEYQAHHDKVNKAIEWVKGLK